MPSPDFNYYELLNNNLSSKGTPMYEPGTNEEFSNNEYPDYTQTVGNSFASSFQDKTEKTENDLNKLQNVASGLFQIYNHVVDTAAKGAPMTPYDSAVISTTIANMTSSVGVESMVAPMLGLESRLDQAIGLQVTQESIGATIKNAINKLFEVLKGLLERFVKWVGEQTDNFRGKTRTLQRLINTVDRHTGLVRIPYTPGMAGILVDNQIPARWIGSSMDTLGAVSATIEASGAMVSYAESILDECKKQLSKPVNDDEFTQELLDKLVKRPKLGLPSVVKRDGNVNDNNNNRTVEWSEPLCDNTIIVAMNPSSPKEPIDAVNYGLAFVTTNMAPDFGIKTAYKTEPSDDQFVSLQIGDLVDNNSRLEARLKSVDTLSTRMNSRIDSVEKRLREVATDYRAEKFGSSFDSDNAQVVLQFAGVARAVISGALASLRSSFECANDTVDALKVIITALNSQHSGNRKNA